jgi:hypothetical protein
MTTPTPAQKRKPGRPQLMDGGKKIGVYLSADDRATAIRLGGGNVSSGIRAALNAQVKAIQ